MGSIDTSELLTLSAASWDKHYSHDEIKQLVAFYESPIGKKMVATQPLIVQESQVAGQQWGATLMRNLNNAIAKEKEKMADKDDAPEKGN